MPTAAYLVAEGISPTTAPGREGKKKTHWCLLNKHIHTCACNEVWWCPYPTNLRPPSHHRPTPVRTRMRPPFVFLRSTKATSLPWICGPPYSLSCGGQVPDVGMPHYRDARMQHRQCTQPALTGVTTVDAPRECQHLLTECSLHPQRKHQEKQKYLQRGKTTTWSTDALGNRS